MGRVNTIRCELLSGPTGEYEYWDETLHLVAIRRGDHTLKITHLEVVESGRGHGWASDGLTALAEVAAEEGFSYLEANVAATNPPTNGDRPADDDPTALCLRKNGFTEVNARKSPRGESEWGFSGYRPIAPTDET